MTIAELMEAMRAAGAPFEAIMIAVKAVEEARAASDAERAKHEERKAKDRARKQAARNGDSASTEVPHDVYGNSAEIPRNVQGQNSEIPRTEDFPYKENHARADGNPNPLTTFEDIITPDLKIGPPEQETARKARSSFFEKFYEAYPKHTNRKAAEKRFEATVRSGVKPEWIIEAAQRFAEATRRARTEKQFIPAPDVWLNKGRYDDEDLPQPQARAGPPSDSYGPQKGGFAISAMEHIENARQSENSEGRAVCDVPQLSFDGGRLEDAGGWHDGGVSGGFGRRSSGGGFGGV